MLQNNFQLTPEQAVARLADAVPALEWVRCVLGLPPSGGQTVFTTAETSLPAEACKAFFLRADVYGITYYHYTSGLQYICVTLGNTANTLHGIVTVNLPNLPPTDAG